MANFNVKVSAGVQALPFTIEQIFVGILKYPSQFFEGYYVEDEKDNVYMICGGRIDEEKEQTEIIYMVCLNDTTRTLLMTGEEFTDVEETLNDFEGS